MENIKLKGSKNIRELGGIKSEKGFVKRGAFLRGSALFALTKKDKKILKENYNLTAVLDLRTSREVMERYDVDIEDVRYYHFPIFDSSARGITHERKEEERRSPSKTPGMAKLYADMVSEKYIENMKKIFKIILSRKASDGALLIHCTEGKDRTGVVVMILLSLLYVGKEEIMQDYMFTNTVNEKKAKNHYLYIKLFYKDEQAAENARNAYLAKEEYMNAAMESLEKHWGSAENYVHKGLGFDMETIERFREEFIVI